MTKKFAWQGVSREINMYILLNCNYLSRNVYLGNSTNVGSCMYMDVNPNSLHNMEKLKILEILKLRIQRLRRITHMLIFWSVKAKQEWKFQPCHTLRLSWKRIKLSPWSSEEMIPHLPSDVSWPSLTSMNGKWKLRVWCKSYHSTCAALLHISPHFFMSNHYLPSPQAITSQEKISSIQYYIENASGSYCISVLRIHLQVFPQKHGQSLTLTPPYSLSELPNNR